MCTPAATVVLGLFGSAYLKQARCKLNTSNSSVHNLQRISDSHVVQRPCAVADVCTVLEYALTVILNMD